MIYKPAMTLLKLCKGMSLSLRILKRVARACSAPCTHLQSRRDCVLQPRVARNELPWVMAACAPQLRRSCAINRNDAMPQSLRRGLIIRGVGATSSRLKGVDARGSQGSSLLATLGFIAESLWDSRSLARIKIRVKCSACSLHGIAGLILIILT